MSLYAKGKARDRNLLNVMDAPENTAKLRELILYICRSSEDDEHFSVTKLNKLLFYSDFGAYLDLNHSISGQEYQKFPYGPVPKVMRTLSDEMSRQGDLAIYENPIHHYIQKRPLALRQPDVSLFSGPEIAMVNQVLRRFRRMTATQISENSHQFHGWQLAKDGETIPYAAALLDKRPLTEQEDEWAHEIDMSEVEEIFREYAAHHQEARAV